LVLVAVVLVVMSKPVVLLLLPGVVVLPIVRLLPNAVSAKLAYFIDPEGGPVAAVGLLVLGASLFGAAAVCRWAWRR
jgi:hypothetical protein